VNATATRRLALLAAPLVAAAAVAIAWQSASVGASRPPEVRVRDQVETKVVTRTQTQIQTQIVQDTSAIQQLSAQIAALQQAVTATAQGLAGQLATLKGSLSSVQSTIGGLQSQVNGAQSTGAAATKKVDDLATTVTGIDQRLSALQRLVADALGAHPTLAPSH